MSFVEQATLILQDKSSANVKKINAELKKLDKTAQSLKKSLAGIKLNVPGAARATKALDTFISKARSASRVKIDPKVNVGNISAATRAINRLHAAANKNIRNQTIQIRRVYTNTGANALINPRNQRVRFDTDSLKGVLNGFIDNLGARLATAIGEGIKIGYSNRDIADTRMTQMSMTPDQRAAAEKIVSANSSRNLGMPQAQGMNLFTEILPSVNQNFDAAKDLLDLTSAIVQFRTAIGDTTQTAVDSAMNIVKAGEQTGAFQKPGPKGTSVYDPQGARAFFTLAQQASAIIGKEFDAKFVRDFITNLGVSKGTLSNRGLASGYLLAEEMKSPKAGVSLNQLIKQLGGRGVKEAVLNNLANWNLIDTEEVVEGSSGKKKTKKRVMKSQVDAALLASDPVGFVAKYVIPQMQSKGLDPNNKTDAQKVAYDLTGDKTAVAGLATIIGRIAELKTQTDQMLGINATPEQQQAIFAQSGLAQLQATGAQISSLLGEIANSFEMYMIPVLTRVQTAAKALSDWVAPPGEEKSAVRGGIVAGGGLIAGALAFFGAKKAIDFMTGLPANTFATVGNTAALNANTAALVGNALTPNGNGPGAKEGIFAAALRFVKGLGVAAAPGLIAEGLGATPGDTFEEQVKYQEQYKQDLIRWGNRIASLFANDPSFKDPSQPTRYRSVAEALAVEQAEKNRAAGFGGTNTLNNPGKLKDDLYIGAETIAQSIQSGATDFEMALGAGASQITTAASGVGSTIGDAFISGAAAVAAAITSALAAGVKVNGSFNQVGAKPAPDTGAATLGHR